MTSAVTPTCLGQISIYTNTINCFKNFFRFPRPALLYQALQLVVNFICNFGYEFSKTQRSESGSLCLRGHTLIIDNYLILTFLLLAITIFYLRPFKVWNIWNRYNQFLLYTYYKKQISLTSTTSILDLLWWGDVTIFSKSITISDGFPIKKHISERKDQNPSRIVFWHMTSFGCRVTITPFHFLR